MALNELGPGYWGGKLHLAVWYTDIWISGIEIF
jgi:hypothetical protein